ncbi:prostaglandin E2 receptor EP2 subtype [Erythrolamprus reginae]|uniref:prostaglandin E2 receptor EP2 subtype n=1 Tax=Erythrolamprus reginae TaxID=121349 RepID=UPI00396CDECE
MMDEAGGGTTRPTPLSATTTTTKGQETSATVRTLGNGPAISAVMFTAGLLGNLTALVLLVLARRRRLARRERLAPFHVLLMALVLTDLLGTCLLSPVVLAAYGRRRMLEWPDCPFFAFSMSFFGLATMSCLGAMALERSLAMAAPYLYERLLSGRPLALLLGALPALYGLAAVFCALPLLGFGTYRRYSPGTWCFIEMRQTRGFALLYASVLLLLILSVLLGNLVVMVSLCRMYMRRTHSRLPAACCGPALGSPLRACRQPESPLGERAKGARRAFSMAEELDHLILLSIMTIIFAVCSLPFTIHAFINNPASDDKNELLVLRFLSLNSIVNPWAFVILRPPILRLLRSMLCCQIPLKSQPKNRQMPVDQMDNCRQYSTDSEKA